MFCYDFLNLPDIKNTDTEEGRYYTTPQGNKYWSVTTLLGRGGDKQYLEDWKARVGEDEAKKIVTQAGIRGSEVHDLAEKYLLSEKNYAKGAMPFNKMTFNVIKKVLDKNVTTIRAIEAGLYSDKIKTAGRVDLIGEWNGFPAIIDFKTAKWRKQRQHVMDYFMQESLYAFMLVELLNPKNLKMYEKFKLVTIMAVDHDDDPNIFIESAADWGPKAIKHIMNVNTPVLL